MAEVTNKPTTATTPSIATGEPTTTAASVTPTPKKRAPGLGFKRFFTKAGVSPYDELEWELRLAQITDTQGSIIFEQKDVEVQMCIRDSICTIRTWHFEPWPGAGGIARPVSAHRTMTSDSTNDKLLRIALREIMPISLLLPATQPSVTNVTALWFDGAGLKMVPLR